MLDREVDFEEGFQGQGLLGGLVMYLLPIRVGEGNP